MINTHAVLACTHCGQAQLQVTDSAARCAACAASFPITRGAIDFRQAEKDLSAGYDIAEDNLIAAKLSAVFDETSTVQELVSVLEGIQRRKASGIALAEIDPRVVLREDGIVPQPSKHSDPAHGIDILAKIKLHLAEVSSEELVMGIALEDGAGLGHYIAGFSQNFAQLFVLDLSMAYMMLARKIIDQHGLPNVTLVCASAERLPFQSDTFDFVHSNNVIEHVTHQDKLFSEARRVLGIGKILFMMSPNRFSLYIEPHFRLACFGFIPTPLRRMIIRRKQNRDISDISLRSLGELRSLARNAFGTNVAASFIPRQLQQTATGGMMRGLITSILKTPVLGGAFHLLINRMALGVMPYHVLICEKRQSAPST